jgi:hypothetical protein
LGLGLGLGLVETDLPFGLCTFKDIANMLKVGVGVGVRVRVRVRVRARVRARARVRVDIANMLKVGCPPAAAQ